MADESGTLSIPMRIGFGWCSDTPPQDADGASILEYRYIPSGLWLIDPEKSIALINRAAQVYPTFGEYPPELIGSEPEIGQAEFTAAGKAFFDSCPIYARLHLKHPYITWTAYKPDGTEGFKVRSGRFASMMQTAIGCSPLDHWAKVCFEPWGDLFQPHPTERFWPMRMRGPVDPDIKGPVTHQSFEQPSNIPVPDATERVEFPVGLYKSVYVSVVADQVRACQRFESTQEMELMKCSLALRRTADAPFEWKDHYVFRFTVPAQYVGRMLKWMDDNEFSHPGGWSVRTVEAVYSPELVDVKFNFTPDVGNYERLFIVFKPLEDLDLSTRLQYEMDVAHMEPPPR